MFSCFDAIAELTWLLSGAISDTWSTENGTGAFGSCRSSMRRSYSRMRLYQALPFSDSVFKPAFAGDLASMMQSAR